MSSYALNILRQCRLLFRHFPILLFRSSDGLPTSFITISPLMFFPLLGEHSASSNHHSIESHHFLHWYYWYLGARGIRRILVCGQALSHCVACSVRDLLSQFTEDFEKVVVLKDGSPGGHRAFWTLPTIPLFPSATFVIFSAAEQFHVRWKKCKICWHFEVSLRGDFLPEGIGPN